MDWRRYAKCAGFSKESYDVFFPTEEQLTRDRWDEAFAFCFDCPVKRPCLELALERDGVEDRFGMFGGFTPKERRWLRQGRTDFWQSSMEARVHRLKIKRG